MPTPNQTVARDKNKGFRSNEMMNGGLINTEGFSLVVTPEKKIENLLKGNKTSKEAQDSSYALKPYTPGVPTVNHSSAGLNHLNIDPNNLISEKRGRISKDY